MRICALSSDVCSSVLLIAYAKAHPGELSYGSSGAGSGGHLAGALLAQRAGIDIVHIPYRGMAPATTALLAGHVKLMVGGLLAAMPSLQTGSLTGLGVSSGEGPVGQEGDRQGRS